jgi:hypothetical protein
MIIIDSSLMIIIMILLPPCDLTPELLIWSHRGFSPLSEPRSAPIL